MMQTIGIYISNVHRRTFSYGFQTFQYLNAIRRIFFLFQFHFFFFAHIIRLIIFFVILKPFFQKHTNIIIFPRKNSFSKHKIHLKKVGTSPFFQAVLLVSFSKIKAGFFPLFIHKKSEEFLLSGSCIRLVKIPQKWSYTPGY